MKDNLIAKFSDIILEASKKEIDSITDINFEIDEKIDNPSNKDVIDCSLFFKQNSKVLNKKETKIKNIEKKEKNRNEIVKKRYNLNNFIV
jgi:hypothetical protein